MACRYGVGAGTGAWVQGAAVDAPAQSCLPTGTMAAAPMVSVSQLCAQLCHLAV